MKSMRCVVAVASNGGIGYQNRIPWPRLKTDLSFMARITTETSDPGKQNAILLGRLTWESLPPKMRPLKDRFNVVISSRPSNEIPGAHLVCQSVEAAMSQLSSSFSDKIESVYVLGGAGIYKEAMESVLCDRIYLTEILADFQADVFFPGVDETQFRKIEDSSVPQGVIEENGVQYRFSVYQRIVHN